MTGSGKFYAKKCDITKEEEVAEVFGWIKKSFGTVNILINNAGMEFQKPIESKICCYFFFFNHLFDILKLSLIFS